MIFCPNGRTQIEGVWEQGAGGGAFKHKGERVEGGGENYTVKSFVIVRCVIIERRR